MGAESQVGLIQDMRDRSEFQSGRKSRSRGFAAEPRMVGWGLAFETEDNASSNLISGRRLADTMILLARMARPGMDRTNLSLGVLTPRSETTVTSPIPDEASGLSRSLAFGQSRLFENGSLRDNAALEIPPQRNGELTRQRHDGDAPNAPFEIANTLQEPLRERAFGLVL